MELTWSHDFCLSCDRQTSGGAYCSQACRLADHEKSSQWNESPVRANDPPSQTTSPSFRHEAGQQGSGFYLSPAINFEAYKASLTTSSSTKTPTSPSGLKEESSMRPLSPSSSRSSLASVTSITSNRQFSEQVTNELLAYTNSFDTTRNWRRRRTWS